MSGQPSSHRTVHTARYTPPPLFWLCRLVIAAKTLVIAAKTQVSNGILPAVERRKRNSTCAFTQR